MRARVVVVAVVPVVWLIYSDEFTSFTSDHQCGEASKPAIILLGGSVAFGYGVTNDEQTISSLLGGMLQSDGYEIFNLAQGGFTSFMDLFSLTTIGLYLEPDIVIVMEGYADTYHLAYKSVGGELAWGEVSPANPTSYHSTVSNRCHFMLRTVF